MKIAGIHLNHSKIARSLKVYKTLASIACEIKELFNYDLEYVDIGGGFYGGMPDKPSFYDYMSIICEVKKFSGVKNRR